MSEPDAGWPPGACSNELPGPPKAVRRLYDELDAAIARGDRAAVREIEDALSNHEA